MRQLGVQEVDIVSIVKPITKYAVTVLDPNDIRYHMEKAVYLAYMAVLARCGSIFPSTCRLHRWKTRLRCVDFDPAELNELMPPKTRESMMQREVSAASLRS